MNGVKVRFLNRDEILPRLVESAKRVLASRADVLEVSLFGSLARGNYAPGSDADIYILLKEDPRRFIDRIPEFHEHFSGAGLPVEVFPYTLEEVAKMGDGGFIKTIEKEKIVLGDREKPESPLSL
ncbi:MAG: nucleotidyltransferase domain-containing protein [Deltaproteobacteria bacterium]|nr:nucleotidyltransferase domain-containing protein [Deltaproteobacteria bacterium]